MPRRAEGNDLVDVTGEIRVETDKAYLFYNGARTAWLPKSQCQWDAEDSKMTMPEWLATDKELI